MQGTLRVPGDKSLSHRAALFAALAQGRSHISGFLRAQDTLDTLDALRALGVSITDHADGRLEVDGVGLHGLKAPDAALYFGNSGTAIRLFSGVLSAQDFDSELTGDRSLSARPMSRISQPLSEMGAIMRTTAGCPPLYITGGQSLVGIDYRLPVPSAQVKSCILLAGLYAKGETIIREQSLSRDHTERLLQAFGYPIERGEGCVSLRGGHALKACDVAVPSDISSAMFFIVLAVCSPQADLIIEDVGINPTRRGALDILQLMGADITLQNVRATEEPIADIRVRSSALRGIEIPKSLVASAIDEFPVLFVAAACAQGKTVLSGAQELRVKESDRLQAMADGLQRLGISVQTAPDGLCIEGGRLQGGEVESADDHRVAMAFAIAGLLAKDAITVRDCAHIGTSFPTFVDTLRAKGFGITQLEHTPA